MNIAGAIHHLSLPCLLLTQGVSLTSLDDSDLWCMYKRNSLSTYSTWLCLYIQFMHKQKCVLPLVRSGTYQVWPSGRLILATCNLPFTSKIIKKNWSRAFKMWRLQRAIKTPAEFPFLHPLLPLDANQRGSCWLSGRADLIWDRNAVS